MVQDMEEDQRTVGCVGGLGLLEEGVSLEEISEEARLLRSINGDVSKFTTDEEEEPMQEGTQPPHNQPASLPKGDNIKGKQVVVEPTLQSLTRGESSGKEDEGEETPGMGKTAKKGLTSANMQGAKSGLGRKNQDFEKGEGSATKRGVSHDDPSLAIITVIDVDPQLVEPGFRMEAPSFEEFCGGYESDWEWEYEAMEEILDRRVDALEAMIPTIEDTKINLQGQPEVIIISDDEDEEGSQGAVAGKGKGSKMEAGKDAEKRSLPPKKKRQWRREST